MDKEVTAAWHGTGVGGGAFYGDVGVAAFSAGDYFAGWRDSAFYNVPLSFQVESPLPEP